MSVDIENVPGYKVLLRKVGQIGYVTRAVNKPLFCWNVTVLNVNANLNIKWIIDLFYVHVRRAFSLLIALYTNLCGFVL